MNKVYTDFASIFNFKTYHQNFSLAIFFSGHKFQNVPR